MGTAAPVPGAPLEVLAPAKVNLALEVLRRRSDGYHEVDTVITTVSLHDTVRLAPLAEAGAVAVEIAGPEAAGIDAQDDLGGRAARLLGAAVRDSGGVAPGVQIAITKRVPHAAGLGGGSSDAAAVLRGLHAQWGLDWPLARLEAIAAEIGSDVPFFLHGGTARCHGRGERVEPLRDLRPLRMLLIVPPVPPVAGKTRRRYAALRPQDFTDGKRVFRLSQRLARGAPPPTADLVNAFEGVVERTESELLAHYARYARTGIPRFHLCGAGPALYCFVHEHARVSELRAELEAAGARVFAVETLPRARALVAADVTGAAG